MPKIENDLTMQSRPALIVAGPRTGGTFLTHCLDAHPQMRWDRGEPFHPQRRYKRMGLGEEDIAGLLFETPGYRVSGFRALYGELNIEAWEIVAAYEPHIIHLVRENVLRQAISVLLNQKARAGQVTLPQHTFGEVEPVRVKLDPGIVLMMCSRLTADTLVWTARLVGTGLPLLTVTYREIVGDRIEATHLDPKAAGLLSDFLDVEWQWHWCDLKRINPAPLSQIITNWREVRAAVEASKFWRCLKDERDAP